MLADFVPHFVSNQTLSSVRNREVPYLKTPHMAYCLSNPLHDISYKSTYKNWNREKIQKLINKDFKQTFVCEK